METVGEPKPSASVSSSGDELQEVTRRARYGLDTPLPKFIRPPLRFRERDGRIEGEVSHPRDIVAMFEPMDVLNGATELVDQDGRVIVVCTDDPRVLDANEYPEDHRGLHYEIGR